MLHISDLHLSLQSISILNGIELKVGAGETVGIIGPNGSGKTTLFNCLSGFHIPSSGTIELDTVDITSLPAYKRAKLGLGRVFQNFGVFKEMTLEENMLTALEGRDGVWASLISWNTLSVKHRREARELLAKVGLEEKAKQPASSLSGGQMRLLEIVRLLAFGAKVFLLDEPTAGVSPKMKQQVVELIEDLKRLSKTVLVIEHDLSFIQRFCARIVVLDQGRIVLDDTAQKIRESALLKEIYFGADGAGR